jgi:hypothetical protein
MIILLVYLAFVVAVVTLLVKFFVAILTEPNHEVPKKQPYAVIALSLFVLAVCFLPWGNALGRVAAMYDISRGESKMHGDRTRGFAPIYVKNLKDRYNIETTSHGCLALPAEIDFAAGYNSVARVAIIKKFGKDVFTECRRDAEAEYLAIIELGNGKGS